MLHTSRQNPPHFGFDTQLTNVVSTERLHLLQTTAKLAVNGAFGLGNVRYTSHYAKVQYGQGQFKGSCLCLSGD